MRNRLIFTVLLCVFLASAVSAADSWKILSPKNHNGKITVPEQEHERVFYRFGSEPLELEVKGPAVLRLRLYRHENQPDVSYLAYSRNNAPAKKLKYQFVGRIKTREIRVPKGTHRYTFFPAKDAAEYALRIVYKPEKVRLERVSKEPEKFMELIPLEVNEEFWEYYRVDNENPMEFTVIGPTSLKFLSRLEFAANMKGVQQYRIGLFENGKLAKAYSLNTSKSEVARYKNSESEFVPSKGSSFFFSVPRGKHNYQIKILEPGQTALLRILIPRKDLKQ